MEVCPQTIFEFCKWWSFHFILRDRKLLLLEGATVGCADSEAQQGHPSMKRQLFFLCNLMGTEHFACSSGHDWKLR